MKDTPTAIIQTKAAGLEIHPVRNKSNREHTIVVSKPDDLRAEADETKTLEIASRAPRGRGRLRKHNR